jgi:uncharacterized protein
MIAYLLITLASLFVAALTLFSGFGLGTLLMPFFAIFFPIEIAVAATAIVHLANNFFKLALMGKHAHWPTVWVFGLPAVIFAVLGALLLDAVSHFQPIAQYQIGERVFTLEWVKITMALLMVGFAVFELDKRYSELSFPRKYLPIGGILSGFFGGLSGHQGALRAAFLSKIGLTKEQFIGTSVVTAILVDVFRLTVYGIAFYYAKTQVQNHDGFTSLVITGILAAFVGSFIGTRLIHKVTMRNIQIMVGILLMLLALLLATGIV